MARSKAAKQMSQEPRAIRARDVSHDTPNDSDAFAEPTQEAIRERAYAIFQARGGAEGPEADDWAQAERELIQLDPRARRRRKTA